MTVDLLMPNGDILYRGSMLQGTTMLVTGNSCGQLVVWNTDSGAIVRVMSHPAFDSTAAQDRGIEQVGQAHNSVCHPVQ